MSVNVIQVLPYGIIFAADRNVTTIDSVTKLPSGQREATKVARVKEKFLLGYVGTAQLGGRDSLEYLIDVIECNEPGNNLDQIAKALHAEIQEQRRLDDKQKKEGPAQLIISLGGFKQRDGETVPEVYYISNSWTLEQGEYKQITNEFGCSDEVRIKFDEARIPAAKVRECLHDMAIRNNPFGFQHSAGLEDFAIVDRFIKTSMDVLAKRNNLPHPTNLEQWISQARMSVLVYSAFWQRFYPFNMQLVGGGSDVIVLPWP